MLDALDSLDRRMKQKKFIEILFSNVFLSLRSSNHTFFTHENLSGANMRKQFYLFFYFDINRSNNRVTR